MFIELPVNEVMAVGPIEYSNLIENNGRSFIKEINYPYDHSTAKKYNTPDTYKGTL